jgi:DNA replication and repair protein RecF
MQLCQLTLKNFRNYSDLKLQVPSGVVVFVGDNGQGKTNLVEAIYLLVRGESFRAGTADTYIRHDKSGVAQASFVKATIEKNGLVSEIQWSSKLGHKKLEMNGKKTSGLQLAREFPIVLFSPESLASIKEGPEFRRLLVDEALLTHSASAVEVLKDYRKALRTRNRVLKDYRKGKADKSAALRLLDSLDGVFYPLGVELTLLRMNALKALEPDLRAAFRYVLTSDMPVEIDYLMSGQKVNRWSRSQVMDAMHQRGLELRSSELETGVTLVGPHRHDIRFLFAGKDSRYFCSQGQQRALILSYKMAQIMYHQRTHQVCPFLLLDDVLSELDPDRRTNLVRFLKESIQAPSQIFLTTTDSALLDFGDRNLSVFRIEDGVIASARNATESIRRRIDSSPRGS